MTGAVAEKTHLSARFVYAASCHECEQHHGDRDQRRTAPSIAAHGMKATLRQPVSKLCTNC